MSNGTRISYIHGIPANERAQRGLMVRKPAPLPYLQMTRGEVKLRLLEDRARLLAAAYPEVSAYRKAGDMLANALNAGVHQGIRFVGAIPDTLQSVAREIALAKNDTAPAAGVLYRNPATGVNTESLLNVNCLEWASKKAKGDPVAQTYWVFKCRQQQRVDKIINDRIFNAAHHSLYHQLYDGVKYPNRVDAKRLLHMVSIEGFALASGLDPGIVQLWVENSIIGKNGTVGAGIYGSEASAIAISPTPDLTWAAYQAAKTGNTQANISGIGFLPAAVIIIGAVTAAITAAAQLLKQLQDAEILAMNEARGYGTKTFSAEESDWIGGAPPATDTGSDTGTGTSSDSTGLLIAGAAVAAYFLLNDNKK